MIPPRLPIKSADNYEWTERDAEAVMVEAIRKVRAMGFRVRDARSGDDIVEFWFTSIHPLAQLGNVADEEELND